MKQYTLTVTITEGSDEFWEEISNERKSGCDEVTEAVRDALSAAGWSDADVELSAFTDSWT